MTAGITLRLSLAVLALLLLTTVFLRYQNPLLEIYLANWGLC
jgi:hypothetical protein